MTEETLSFEAEVTKLLEIVVHSLYSDKEIFLRELISNASDACDKLRYEAITNPEILGGDTEFAIWLIPDSERKTLIVADNGIGMSRDELKTNLGTIAKSGSADFLNAMSAEKKKDLSLIGQFGVGFYSAFMVADRVEVVSRRAGAETGYRWTSDGKGTFSIAEASEAARGTRITLHLGEDDRSYLDPSQLRRIVKTYSDHIGLPIKLVEDGKETVVNSAAAIWTRPKSEISDSEYKEFYHHVAHAFDEPWHTLHMRAEGAIEYTALLFIPGERPFDLYDPERKPRVKLYVNRVFITDEGEVLLPSWLRFLRGVVDSADLPLNVSRELLQRNPVLAKIKTGLVKRVIAELRKRAEDAESYAAFWTAFGALIKEGVYEDFDRRAELLDLCRFASLNAETPISLADYKANMKPGQKAIYYLTGEDKAAMKESPLIEGFRSKGVDVLLLTDPIDEFWPAMAPEFDGTPFRSVGAAGDELEAIETEGADPADGTEPEEDTDKAATATLIARLKTALGDQIKDVRSSSLLRESPVCLVPADGDISIHMERLLRMHQQHQAAPKRIMEINPRHELIRTLGGLDDQTAFSDLAQLLLDQARIVEGEPVADAAAFARRMTAVLQKSLSASS